jgi:hypothetical protein
MLGVISQAKVFVESQAAKRVNCVQKTLLDYWKKYRKNEYFIFFYCSVKNLASAEIFRLRRVKRKPALAEKFSGPVRFRLRRVLLYNVLIFTSNVRTKA